MILPPKKSDWIPAPALWTAPCLPAEGADKGGAFELADAERSVLFIGSADRVRRRLGEILVAENPLASRTAFVRLTVSESHAMHAHRLLSAYRQAHGALPPGHGAP